MKSKTAPDRLTIGEYVRNKSIRASTTFRVLPSGEKGYVVDGNIVSDEEFDKMYPVDVPFLQAAHVVNSKGANCDRTKEWLYGGRSY